MMEALRGFVGSWAAKILLLLLVGSFALWGVSDQMLGGGSGYTVAEVGETKVTATEYLGTYNRNLNVMQQRLGQRLTREQARVLGLENQALGAVVAFATLDEYARESGIALSDTVLARMIRDNEAFQSSDGTFNRDRFRQALYNARMLETDFINLQNQTAVRQQITEAMAIGGLVPDVFKAAVGGYVNEERRFSWLLVKPDLAGKPEVPDDTKLKAYFEENKATYAAPEYRKLTLLSLEPKDVADESAVTDEEIRAEYDASKTQYVTEERRRIQQIVFKTPESANEAVATLSGGGLFETVLSDNKVAAADADLGFATKAALPEQIRDAVFALELNEPSALLDGPFGKTMVRVTEIQPRKETPFDEVKDKIRTEIALRLASETLSETVETLEDTRAGGLPLTEVGEKLQLKVRTIDAVDARGRTPQDTQLTDIPASSEVLRQAFQTEVGAQASPVELSQTGGLVWYDVVSIEKARDRRFDEVAQKVRKDWTQSEQFRLLEAKAKELADRVRAGETLNAVALDLGMLDETTPFIKRNAETPQFSREAVTVGFSVDAKDAAFVRVPGKEEVRVVSIAEVRGDDAKPQDAPKEQLDLARDGAADDLINQLIVSLQNRYSITQNPQVISRILTENPN